MNYPNKQYFSIIFLATLIITSNPFVLFAENIKTTVGFKSNYSTGISDTNIAYKPFAKMKYEINFVDIEATGTYIIYQQITDGMGNFAEINIGQGQIKTMLTIGDVIEIGGGYAIAKGHDSYNSTLYMFNGSIYIGSLTIDLDYSNENKNYDFNGDIEILNNTFIGSVSYDINDVVGYELDYHYTYNNFSNMGYSYDKNIVRMGISVYGDQTIYMGGINAGKDSGDYMIYGADIGLNKKFYNDSIKIMIAYNVDYYNPPTVSSTSGGGHGGSHGGVYKGMNP